MNNVVVKYVQSYINLSETHDIVVRLLFHLRIQKFRLLMVLIEIHNSNTAFKPNATPLAECFTKPTESRTKVSGAVKKLAGRRFNHSGVIETCYSEVPGTVPYGGRLVDCSMICHQQEVVVLVQCSAVIIQI